MRGRSRVLPWDISEPALRLPQSRGCGKGSEKSAEAIVAEMPFSEGLNRFCAAVLSSDPYKADARKGP